MQTFQFLTDRRKAGLSWRDMKKQPTRTQREKTLVFKVIQIEANAGKETKRQYIERCVLACARAEESAKLIAEETKRNFQLRATLEFMKRKE
jgi:hypothetical protein